METQQQSTKVKEYDPIEQGLDDLRERFKEVPDVTTKEGFKLVKTNLKEYRATKKNLEDTRKGAKAAALEYGRKVDSEAKRIGAALEDIFGPHKAAKEAEEQRLAEIEEAEAKAAAERVAAIQKRMEGMKQIFVESVGMTSEIITNRLTGLTDLDINESSFGDFELEARQMRDALIGKMTTLIETTKASEEMAIKFEAHEREREIQEKVQREKDIEEQKKRDEEAIKLKAENDAMRAELDAQKAKQEEEQRIINEREAEIRAQEKRIETEKREAAEEVRQANLRANEEFARKQREEEVEKLTLKRIQELEEEIKIQEAEEKKEREDAEALAKKEAKLRRHKLAEILDDYVGSMNRTDDLIDAIENNEIPFVSLDWCKE